MPDYTPTTALIVVDIQNDFADPNGTLYVPGAGTVIEQANIQIDRALRAGAPVIYTQDWHPEHTPHFDTHGGPWPVHCVKDTWGAAFHPQLHVEGETIRKGSNGEDGYSGFTMRNPTTGRDIPTPLHPLLEDRHIDHLVIIGLALDVCVKATALDALRLGYPTTLIQNATAPVNLHPNDATQALTELTEAGATLD